MFRTSRFKARANPPGRAAVTGAALGSAHSPCLRVGCGSGGCCRREFHQNVIHDVSVSIITCISFSTNDIHDLHRKTSVGEVGGESCQAAPLSSVLPVSGASESTVARDRAPSEWDRILPAGLAFRVSIAGDRPSRLLKNFHFWGMVSREGDG